MSNSRVSVMVPVGPYPVYKKWLPECLASIQAQTREPAEVLLIDDMAGIALDDVGDFANMIAPKTQEVHLLRNGKPVGRVWMAPWRLGDVGAFNCGVSLAHNDLVFMLSCDDFLEPDCLEMCVAEWEKHHQKDAFYWVGCRYLDTGETQALPFSAAMVTKGFWQECGGFPVETTGCGGDAALVSILLTHLPDRLIKVAGGRPLYNYRRHSETETAKAGPWFGVMAEVRGLVTSLWEPPKWGRMS